MLKQGRLTTVQTLFMLRVVLRGIITYPRTYPLIQSHVAKAGAVSVHVGSTGSQLQVVVDVPTYGQITLVIHVLISSLHLVTYVHS